MGVIIIIPRRGPRPELLHRHHPINQEGLLHRPQQASQKDPPHRQSLQPVSQRHLLQRQNQQPVKLKHLQRPVQVQREHHVLGEAEEDNQFLKFIINQINNYYEKEHFDRFSDININESHIPGKHGDT